MSAQDKVGIVEANPLVTCAELDAIRSAAEQIAKDIGLQGYTLSTAIQNQAAQKRMVCTTDTRDPGQDVILVYTFSPLLSARTIATVRAWLSADETTRADYIKSAVLLLLT